MTATVIKIHWSYSTAIYCCLWLSTVRSVQIFFCAVEKLEQQEVTRTTGMIQEEMQSLTAMIRVESSCICPNLE